MKLYFKILFIATLVTLVAVFGYIYIAKYQAKKYYYSVKNTALKVYVYETYNCGSLNSVLYIDNLSDSFGLISYYNNKKDNDYASINFPLKVMPINTKRPAYVLSDISNTLAEVIDIDTNCWGYIRGYVFKETLHSKPPSDSLIKKFLMIDDNYGSNLSSENKLGNRFSNPYGWYCSCE